MKSRIKDVATKTAELAAAFAPSNMRELTEAEMSLVSGAESTVRRPSMNAERGHMMA